MLVFLSPHPNVMALFSVGDCIAAAKLIKDVVEGLSTASSAATDYQSLICDVGTLASLLKAIENARLEVPPSNLGIIQQTIEDCERCLGRYSFKLRKYHRSLGPAPSKNRLVHLVRRLWWAFVAQKTIGELRQIVTQKIGILNLELGLGNLYRI